jgi:geranylgeranyl reductase
LGSLLRGQALAPSTYGSVPSAVGRSDGDFLADEAAQAIKAQSSGQAPKKGEAEIEEERSKVTAG